MSSKIANFHPESERRLLGNPFYTSFNYGPREVSGGAQRPRSRFLDSEFLSERPLQIVVSSKIQKCLQYLHMSSELENPICPRN